MIKYNKLLILLVLFTMIAGCSFIQEERTVLKLSSDGKLVSTAADEYEAIEIEEVDEPPEIEISNPMPVREMSAPEMPVPEMSLPDMPLREMSLPEMPVRNN